MYLAYLDEAGDDGFPAYSSELFVLTAVYMHYSVWKDNYHKIEAFRKQLKQTKGLPINIEMHMRSLILGKKPYHEFRWGRAEKREIFYSYFDLICSLDIRVVNVAIIKSAIKNTGYRVLDTALRYSIQRIENDMREKGENHNFITIVDDGRVGGMRATARRVQRINYIPSKLTRGTTYRREIECLIEDPLPKSSKQSHFIQVADGISFAVYLYALIRFCHGQWANRIRAIELDDVLRVMERMKTSGILNLKACNDDNYAVVHYPK